MQYLAHDISENLFNASRSNNVSLKRDIMMDEIAKLVASEPLQVQKAIIDADIKIPVEPTKKQFAKILSDNLGKNKKLRKNLSTLIIKNYEMPNELNFSGYIPTLNNNAKKKLAEKKMSSYNFIYDNMYSSFNAEGDNAIDEKSIELALVGKIKVHKSNYDVISGQEKLKVKKIVIVTSLITTAAIVGGYFLVKYIKKRNAQKFESGGELQNDMQPQTQTQPQTQSNTPFDANGNIKPEYANSGVVIDPSFANNNMGGGEF